MLKCRNRDTVPEIALRSAVHRLGLRFRVAARPIKSVRRTADMVFGPSRVAVFCDGCFWHACPQHFVAPSTNTDYWDKKIAGNVARDRDTDALLAKAGWLVIRVWEHEDMERAAQRVAQTVRKRRDRALISRSS
jgi:DNA mismatch endonuclease (patch repair protein)